MSIGRLSTFIRRLRGDMAAGQPGGLSDAQLLDRWLAQRDQAAFEVLLWRHGPMVLGVCRRVLNHDADVEDAFQAAFLLLVRKATAIRRRESIAAWLYQTAYRVALRARQRSARQSAHETTTNVEWLGDNSTADVVWREVRPILDDEINRLPEKYRVPFIRCYLEGCTNEEVAVELNCPLGTIHSRLAWARERLRFRLSRRGVTLATAGVAALLAPNAASAVPPALAEATLQAAFAHAAHSTVVAASAGAVALANEVVRSTSLTKWKLGAAVLLAVTLCAGAGVAFYHRMGAPALPPGGESEPAAAPQPPPPAAAAPVKRPIREVGLLGGGRKELVAFVSTHSGEVIVQGKSTDRVQCLATEVKPSETVPEKKKIVVKWWLLAIPEKDQAVPVEDRVIVEDADQDVVYRRWQPKDGFPAGQVRLGYVLKTLRKLSEGEVVQTKELLALYDTERIRRELADRLAKINAAEASLKTVRAKREQAANRYLCALETNAQSPGDNDSKDIEGLRLTVERFQQEEAAIRASLQCAQGRAHIYNNTPQLREIRAPTTGKLQVIHYQDGAAVAIPKAVMDILPDEPLAEK